MLIRCSCGVGYALEPSVDCGVGWWSLKVEGVNGVSPFVELRYSFGCVDPGGDMPCSSLELCGESCAKGDDVEDCWWCGKCAAI
jgi:hypothetical protein